MGPTDTPHRGPRCCAGLLRHSSGGVHLDGVDVGTASDAVLTDLRRTRVGSAFQQYNRIPALTAMTASAAS